MSESHTKRKKQRKVIVIILVIIVAILLSIIIAIPLSNKGSEVNQTQVTPESTPLILNDNREGIEGTYQTMSREEILESLQSNQKLVTDSVSSNVTFPSGKAGVIGEWVLENTKVNSVIQQAEIYLDHDMLIAKTEPVYPGQFIQAVELIENLEQGEYEVIAYISYYNVDDKVFAGKAGYKIHLTVQ